MMSLEKHSLQPVIAETFMVKTQPPLGFTLATSLVPTARWSGCHCSPSVRTATHSLSRMWYSVFSVISTR